MSSSAVSSVIKGSIPANKRKQNSVMRESYRFVFLNFPFKFIWNLMDPELSLLSSLKKTKKAGGFLFLLQETASQPFRLARLAQERGTQLAGEEAMEEL